MSQPDLNTKDKGPNELTQFSTNDFGTVVNGTVTNENHGSLKYPLNINSKQDRIFITQYRYQRSGVLQREGDIALTTSVGTVTLPIPNDISENNSVGWGEDSLGNIAAGAMSAVGKMVVGTSQADFGEFKEGVGELGKFLSSKAVGLRGKQFLTTRAAAAIVSKFGVQVNPEAYITRATGAAINPNLELLFNGPKLRQFGFQFKMTARSKDEAKQIRKIIRFFKQGMAPRKGSGNETSFFLGTPNVFKMEFKSVEGGSDLKSIGRIKTCALVSFGVNYTPDGFYAAYEDSSAGGSQPIAVTMQMGFTELTPIFNDEYDSNYDDIGPNLTPKADLTGTEQTKISDTYNFTPEEYKAAGGLNAFADVQNNSFFTGNAYANIFPEDPVKEYLQKQ